MKIYDITRPLAPTIAVWPGDPPFERGWEARISHGDPANVGWMRTGLHAGTHADAPFHFLSGGTTIDHVPLNVFIGEALLIDARPASIVHASLLPEAPLPQRILFRTAQSERPDEAWDPEFPAVDPTFAEVLAARGVVLIGTDSPSVDPFGSETLEAHHALARHGVHILENLQLSDVNPGRYLLVAAPLKLSGMDGAPVRAVLIDQRL